MFGLCLVPHESQLLAGLSPYGDDCRGAAWFKALTPHTTEPQESLRISQDLCIPQELEEATSNPRSAKPEPGFWESRPVWDGRTAGREDSGFCE